MIPNTFDQAFEQVKTLVEKFRKDEKHYLENKYQEAEVRQDFLDKFFVALGWDVYHHAQVNPYEREVKIEKSVMVQGRGKRADYAFYTAPNFAQARFMAEAKKPSRQLENAQDCFQAIRYGWNSNTPISVLTDFEQFLVLDSRYKPSVETSVNRIIKKFHYTDFVDEEKFRELYFLFSREAVGDNSLETFAAGLKKSKGARQAKLFNTAIIQPIDEEFLNELDEQRVNLARAFKNRNPELDGETLTEITQRTLDRLVFLRFLEDKLVEPDAVIDGLGKKSGSAWRDFIGEMPRLNKVYNGTLFRAHSVLDNPNFAPDERAFGETRDWLAHVNSPYDFNSIPIHILGSIYERFLGKTIETTDKRATVVDKPEVRKAGGVYYTPEYIVRYIVENTIGKLIEKKKPEDIAALRFADIACGSGSFLLGVFDYLIKYHVAYFNANKTRRAEAIKQGLCRETADGTLQLTIHFKREILTNNIYGVDLDAQAVEVAQLSLYLKLLEEETTATKQQFLTGFREQLLPSLGNNIVHGNSLIDYDIMDGMLFDTRELKQLNPMNFAQTFPEIFQNGGFDAIVGNPPYVFGRDWKALQIPDFVKDYLGAKYKSSPYQLDMFSIFMERAITLCKDSGFVGQIVPNVWLTNTYSSITRKYIFSNSFELFITVPTSNVFKGLTVDTIVYTLRKSTTQSNSFHIKRLSIEQSELLASFRTDDFKDGVRPISTSLDNDQSNLIKKISILPNKLIDFAQITRGVHPYRLGGYGQTAFGKGFQIEKDISERPYHSTIKQEGYRAFIYGKDLKRFTPPKEKEYISYGKWLAEPRNQDFFEGERIYSRKILSDRLVITVENTDSVADQQVYITKILDENLSAKFFAGILGSKLMAYFIRNFYDEVNDAFPQIKVGQLKSLPIPLIDFNNSQEKAAHDRMVELVEKMLGAKKSLAVAQTDKDKTFFERYCDSLDGQIDVLVYQLYQLTPDEIKIIENT